MGSRISKLSLALVVESSSGIRPPVFQDYKPLSEPFNIQMTVSSI